MFEAIKISNLPPYAKLFVGLFTTLMLAVCAWTILILYIQEGMISEDDVPAYVTNHTGRPKQKTTPSQSQKRAKPKTVPARNNSNII